MKKAINYFLFVSIFVLAIGAFAIANEQPLILFTNTSVTEDGEVGIHLTLKNKGENVLYEVQPMIHFHHTMAMMPKIAELKPGQKIMFQNDDHPPVLRSGRYPIVIMTQYKNNLKMKRLTSIHTDSFYFREQVESAIVGKINMTLNGDESLLDIFLKNNSTSFKNIRLMLLLPPGLVADELAQMMGLTIRGGQEKNIKVAVKRENGSPDIVYPVHLLVEYGEMLNHYTSDISGEIDFRSIWERTAIVPALSAVVIFIALLLLRSFFKTKNPAFFQSMK